MIKLPIAALVVVVALLGGFYGGYKVGGGGTAAAASGTGSGNTRTGTANFGGGRFTACPTTSGSAAASPEPSGATIRRGATGTVTNLTANSLTVHDARCNTDVTVDFTSTVIIRKTTLGATSDLQENETVAVTGTRQADGSIKANSITIVPAGSGAGAGFFGGGGGASSGN
jgi:hypothetical protein